MNLAIDYMIRTQEFRHMVKLPYCVFLNGNGHSIKMVMTVATSFVPEKLVVKHWLLEECRPANMVPPFIEFEIPQSEMYSSERVIVSGYDPLWYSEEPTVAGKVQRPDPPHAELDEREYQSTVDNFLNSQKHKSAREDWLWQAFAKSYALTDYVFVPWSNYAELLKRVAPSLQQNWMAWKKYLLNYSLSIGDVAGELFFHGEYADKAVREGRKVEYRSSRVDRIKPLKHLHWEWNPYMY
jgi:hypothetical protein